MTYGTKVATCCYCGTRAALVLRGKDRHELSCSSCGAPLHNMKMLRSDAVQGHPVVTPQPERGGPRNRPGPTKHSGKPKKRKSTARWLMGEIWDLVEDVFD